MFLAHPVLALVLAYFSVVTICDWQITISQSDFV